MMACQRHLCVLISLLSSVAVVAAEGDLVVKRTVQDYAEDVREATVRVEELGRRLFGFSWPDQVPDPGQLANQAGQIANDAGGAVGDAAGHVGNAAQGSFGHLQQTYNSAKALVEEGLQVMTNAVGASGQFSNDMSRLFEDFSPLQPVFAATHGLVTLVTNKRLLSTLVSFLVDLMRSAAELVSIGNAVGAVSAVFTQLYDVFHKELSKINGDGGGRRLFGVDYTSLLGGLDFNQLKTTFDEFGERASTYVTQVKSINETIYPTLLHLEGRLGSRRLFETVGADQQKYEGAILSVVPTWQNVENLAIDVCGKTHGAMRQMSSLQCRIQSFATSVQLPGTGEVTGMVDNCDEQAVKEALKNHTDCPGTAQSAQVRDMLSDNAGVLGWICVTFEYMIHNSEATRIFFGMICLSVGLPLAVFGYRYKDCEFWVEGFVAGLVVWSIVISVIIVYFGVCRGQIINTCEPIWLLLTVVLLSVVCAIVTVKAQSVQLFLSGFDLGAILGGFIYISQLHEQIFHTFVSADDQQAKVIIGGFLGTALASGILLGVLTTLAEKPVIIVATSAIGSFIVIISIAIFFPHWLDVPDLIGWAALTIAAIVVQYMYTAPGKPGEKGKKDEEQPLTS